MHMLMMSILYSSAKSNKTASLEADRGWCGKEAGADGDKDMGFVPVLCFFSAMYHHLALKWGVGGRWL